jgi:hypothetical protein
MAWSAHSTYVVADGGPGAVVVARIVHVHVATPVDTWNAAADAMGDALHAIDRKPPRPGQPGAVRIGEATGGVHRGRPALTVVPWNMPRCPPGWALSWLLWLTLVWRVKPAPR